MIRSTFALIRALLTEIGRSKTALFWMTAFPIGFLLLFGFVMARGDARVAAFLMPGLLTTTLMSGSLFGVAFRSCNSARRAAAAPARHAGAGRGRRDRARRHGDSDGPDLARRADDARAPAVRRANGLILAGAGIVTYLCGACALVPLGLLVGSTARDIRTAPAIANPLFFPLMFLSGSAMPFAVLPEGGSASPVSCPRRIFNESYSGVIVRGEGLMTLAGSLAVLLAIGVVGIVPTSMLFRWEGTEPIPRRSLAIIAVAFTLTLGVSALAARRSR